MLEQNGVISGYVVTLTYINGTKTLHTLSGNTLTFQIEGVYNYYEIMAPLHVATLTIQR